MPVYYFRRGRVYRSVTDEDKRRALFKSDFFAISRAHFYAGASTAAMNVAQDMEQQSRDRED